MQLFTGAHSANPIDNSTPGPVCAHHWLIEAPAGQTSRGVCKRCGARRDFANSLDEVAYVPFDRSDWRALAERRS